MFRHVNHLRKQNKSGFGISYKCHFPNFKLHFKSHDHWVRIFPKQESLIYLPILLFKSIPTLYRPYSMFPSRVCFSSFIQITSKKCIRGVFITFLPSLLDLWVTFTLQVLDVWGLRIWSSLPPIITSVSHCPLKMFHKQICQSLWKCILKVFICRNH